MTFRRTQKPSPTGPVLAVTRPEDRAGSFASGCTVSDPSLPAFRPPPFASLTLLPQGRRCYGRSPLSLHLVRAAVVASVILTFVACGPKPEPGDVDAGVEQPEDAGVDAGTEQPDSGALVDAGADAGFDAGFTDAGILPRPDTFLLSRPPNFTTSANASFTFVANSTGLSFECSLDGAPYATCTSPFAATSLPDGDHIFGVRALDANGEPDLTPDGDGWTIDPVVPETTISSSPPADVNEPRGSVAMTCNEAVCLFECSLNGGPYFSCTSPHSFEGLSSGMQTVSIRALDRAGNVDATPSTASFNVLPGTVTFRIAAANLTSGNLQSYDSGEGLRIFQGLDPDIVLIQEMNYGSKSAADIRSFVDTAFSPSFSYYRESSVAIPNGVISRFPIVASGSWDDTAVSNRDFAWARINIPGPKDLWAVSVHFLTTSASARDNEAKALTAFIQANVPAGDLLAVGGDYNTSSRGESAVSSLAPVLVTTPPNAPYPVDQQGNSNTNAARNAPYDWLLVDADLNALRVPTVIGSTSSPAGLVFDSRVFSPLSAVSPVVFSDSGANNMQHMAVVKDFTVAY